MANESRHTYYWESKKMEETTSWCGFLLPIHFILFGVVRLIWKPESLEEEKVTLLN